MEEFWEDLSTRLANVKKSKSFDDMDALIADFSQREKSILVDVGNATKMVEDRLSYNAKVSVHVFFHQRYSNDTIVILDTGIIISNGSIVIYHYCTQFTVLRKEITVRSKTQLFEPHLSGPSHLSKPSFIQTLIYLNMPYTSCRYVCTRNGVYAFTIVSLGTYVY